jgi:hypothetical protein
LPIHSIYSLLHFSFAFCCCSFPLLLDGSQMPNGPKGKGKGRRHQKKWPLATNFWPSVVAPFAHRRGWERPRGGD